MKVEINVFHMQVTPEINALVEKKLGKLDRYFKEISTSHVIIRLEKGRYWVEINTSVNKQILHSNAVDTNLYTSVEVAVNKIIKQAKKFKEKIKSHKSPRQSEKSNILAELSEVVSDQKKPRVVQITKELVKPMSVEEAIIQLNISRDKFYVFLNAENNNINVIYKRENGNFGLIQPEI